MRYGNRQLTVHMRKVCTVKKYMRKRYALLIVVFVILSSSATMPSHTVYLPHITNGEAKIGFAWMSYTTFDDFDVIGMSPYAPYYHASTWEEDPSPQSIPVVWDDSAESLDKFEQMQQGRGCPLYLKSPNEPDIVGQADMTPQEVAELILLIEADCPTTTVIWWNGNDLNHLSQTIEAYQSIAGRLPPLPVGIHYYYASDPAAWTDDVCDLLGSHGYTECRVWASEIGMCDHQQVYSWIKAADNHPAVERIFWYTNNGKWWSPRCHNAIRLDGTLTPTGEELRRYLTGLQSAYP